MAKTKKSEDQTTEDGFTTAGGVLVQGEVIVGTDNHLTSQEQGAKARGELDENGNPISGADKVAEAEKAANAQASAKAVESGLTDKEKAVDAALVERRKVLEAAGEGPQVLQAKDTLYQGWLTVGGVASTTGEEISVKFEQAEAETEDGVFRAFRSYFPAAKREGFWIDPKNEKDPTLRTYLETGTRRQARGR